MPTPIIGAASRLRNTFGRAPRAMAFAILIFGGLMNDGIAADASQKWQTDKVRLLDSKEFVTATSKALHGGIAGTGKQYDLQKVTDELNEMLIAELKDPRGVHIETALATLGALAGFSVQMAIRDNRHQNRRDARAPSVRRNENDKR